MKISEVFIENFRSIEKCCIHFDQINAIVGENNAGKTSILRAINSVMNFENEKQYFENKSHQHITRRNSKIIINFDDIPERDYYKDKVINGKFSITFQYAYNQSRRVLSIQSGNEKSSLDADLFEKILEDIKFIYIPTERGGEDLKWAANSVFTQLITQFTNLHTQNRDNFSRRVKLVADDLHRNVLTKIEKEICSLNMLEDCEEFKLGFDEFDYRVFIDKVGLKLSENGYALTVLEQGSGKRSLTAIALYRILAKLTNAAIVFGIEEPEANLHPQAQKKLISNIFEKHKWTQIQTILTTHSTVIVDELEHDNIILVRRKPSPRRAFVSEITQLSKDFWQRNQIENIKHYNFFKYRNSDFFFSKYVIITESTTDAQLVKRLLSKKHQDGLFSIGIINLNGVEWLRYPYCLLNELNIPFSVILDRDFFSPYLNGSLAQSRATKTGLPLYSTSAKRTDFMIKKIFPTEAKLNALEAALNGSYSQLCDFLYSYGLFSMQYCLEMDLSCSKSAREKYYEILKLPTEHRNQRGLLLNCSESIKKAINFTEVVDSIQPRDYPISYKKISLGLAKHISSYLG